MRILILTLLLTACSVAHDTEIVPVWDDAQTDADHAAWAAEVQDAIDAWQAVLGDDCAFPIFIGTEGPTIRLIAPSSWNATQDPTAIGKYYTKSGDMTIRGDAPRTNGTTTTIAHELGHAAGLSHRRDSTSVMHHTNNGILPSVQDGQRLRTLLQCTEGK